MTCTDAQAVAGAPEVVPTVSVVVGTCHRPHLLAALVDALAPAPELLEAIVVVDGEDPASVRRLQELRLERPWLVPLNPGHRGQLGALDHGVAHARGDVVLLLDDDVLPGPGLVSGHVRHHRRASGLVVMGHMPVRRRATGHEPAGTRLYAEEYLGHVGKLARGDLGVLDGLWTGNVSLRRADCLRIGLRSPDFQLHYHADRDLGYRLAQGGLTGVYDPSLAATHIHHRTATAFLRDARRQGAGQVLLRQLHPERPNPERPADPPSRLGRAGAAAVQVVGGSALAQPTALATMGIGYAAGRLGAPDAEVTAARVARRLMLRRGAVAGAG